jgi:hypothetical protein
LSAAAADPGVLSSRSRRDLSEAAPDHRVGARVSRGDPSAGHSTPGGVLQLFPFKGAASGQSIVLFHNPASGLVDVIDTVVVR